MNIKKYTGFEYRFGVSLMLLVLIGFYFTLGDSWILPRFSFKSRPGKMEIETERVAKLSVPFKVDISVDTDGQSVNAVGAFVRFDPQKLQLIDMDTSKSFCQYYPERKFDNGLGTVSLSCGSPHPGFSGTQTVMTLEFIPLILGDTNIFLDPSSKLLLSNGKGVNILQDPGFFSVSVQAAL